MSSIKLSKIISNHKSKYQADIFRGLYLLNEEKIKILCELFINSEKSNKNIFICGNGGSYSNSNHIICDIVKLLYRDTKKKIRLYPISINPELITAIGNDINFNKIFSNNLEIYGRKGDAIIILSCSGNSKNIIELAKIAKKNKINIYSITGFNGGKLKKISDFNINIESDNYGIIEDIHSSIFHIISQSLRMMYSYKKIKFL